MDNLHANLAGRFAETKCEVGDFPKGYQVYVLKALDATRNPLLLVEQKGRAGSVHLSEINILDGEFMAETNTAVKIPHDVTAHWGEAKDRQKNGKIIVAKIKQTPNLACRGFGFVRKFKLYADGLYVEMTEGNFEQKFIEGFYSFDNVRDALNFINQKEGN